MYHTPQKHVRIMAEVVDWVQFSLCLPTLARCTFKATCLDGVLQGAYPIDEELQVGICYLARFDTPADTFL